MPTERTTFLTLKMRPSFVMWLLAILVCPVIAVSMLVPLLETSSHGPGYLSGKCGGIIKGLSGALWMYEHDHGAFLGKGTYEREPYIREVVNILQGDNARGDVYIGWYADNRLIADPWGRNYHVLFDGDGDGTIKVGEELVPADSVIWSDGPNRVNDWGEGDDVCSWK